MTQSNVGNELVDASLETLVADDSRPAVSHPLSQGVAATVRTTVLPKRRHTEASAPAEIPVQARFERLKKLGEGGIGEVDLAVDHDISRRVAMKRLRSERQDAHSLVRFAEEVRIVGQLEHPGIVPLHDVGVDEAGQHYLVMKYVEGDTLETVIEKLRAGDAAYCARFSFAYRVQVMASILEAIGYAHDKGIIHRDIKPANIMIGPHGEVTVMDWGIAKHVGSEEDTAETAATASTVQDRLIHTQHGALVGTPLYMSPEQACGKNTQLDARSDIFALGVVFAELLTLRHPLEHKREMNEVLAELIAKGIEFGPLVNHARQVGVPMELAYVLRESLEHDPQKRYPSVKAMLAHLRRIQDGAVAVQCHVTAFKRAAYETIHWVDRNPLTYTMLLGVTLLSMLTGLGYGVFRLVH